MRITETSIRSKRDTDIPVTVVDSEQEKPGLLICVHGFKANRTEDGRFLEVAEKMAEHGMNAIMMGFPGCDESKEDFINYSLTSCLDDIDSCVAYMNDKYDCDAGRTAMIGYSMGGRLTALYVRKHPEVRAISLWAAATYEGFDGQDTFLGEDLLKMKKEAEQKGYCDFYNSFDNETIKLSRQLIDDMENMDPVEGLRSYRNAAIVIHGDIDDTVEPRVAAEAYEHLSGAADRKLVIIEGADHGFGAWNDRLELSKQLVDNTTDYLREKLC